MRKITFTLQKFDIGIWLQITSLFRLVRIFPFVLSLSKDGRKNPGILLAKPTFFNRRQRIWKSWAGLMLLLLTFAAPLPAAVEYHPFDDPAKEEAYQSLISELRCLVCQNQTIADSNADLAKDLRQHVSPNKML